MELSVTKVTFKTSGTDYIFTIRGSMLNYTDVERMKKFERMLNNKKEKKNEKNT